MVVLNHSAPPPPTNGSDNGSLGSGGGGHGGGDGDGDSGDQPSLPKATNLFFPLLRFLDLPCCRWSLHIDDGGLIFDSPTRDDEMAFLMATWNIGDGRNLTFDDKGDKSVLSSLIDALMAKFHRHHPDIIVLNKKRQYFEMSFKMIKSLLK